MLCRGVLEGGATGLLNKGGREQQASWFSKQQAMEFPQVLTSNNSFITVCTCMSTVYYCFVVVHCCIAKVIYRLGLGAIGYPGLRL